jgi:hypothetical protein
MACHPVSSVYCGCHIEDCVCSTVTLGSWEPTEVVGGIMDAVARKALGAMFKLHPKDAAGEICLEM